MSRTAKPVATKTRKHDRDLAAARVRVGVSACPPVEDEARLADPDVRQRFIERAFACHQRAQRS
jgi:hypothetical protein